MPGPSHTAPSMPPLAAVGVLSAAVLSYEILLMRLFAIVHWHHFAFMMISIALLGYGASGTFLMLLPSLGAGHLRSLFLAGAAGFSVACVVCFVAAQHLPFNALEVFWDPRQWGYLAGVYGLLFLPFFSAATAIGAVLRFGGPRIPQIYAADLCGAGIGACMAAGILFRLPPLVALVVVAAAGAAAALVAAFYWKTRWRRRLTVTAAGWLVLTGLGAAQWETLSINA
ncbi:MAG: hypothetical protein JJV98_21635, partial [Desulfosarcina sp.]|nr:hypothetical protein [Desulfobacterales bacterium]